MPKHLHLSILFTFLFLTSLASAQPDSIWTSMVVGNGGTVLTSAAVMPEGGFLLAGYSDAQETGDDFFAARVDQDGQVIWLNNYAETPAEEQINGVAISGETIVLAGYGQVNDTPEGYAKLMLMGLNFDGDSLWTREYPSPFDGASKARGITRLNDGNLGVIGFSLGADGQHDDVWFLKCDEDGDTLWTRTYGTSETDVSQGITQSMDGTIWLLCNQRTEFNNTWDYWVIAVNANGEVVTDYTFGTQNEDEYAYGIAAGSDGSIYVVGRQGSPSDPAAYLVRIPPEGEAQTRVFDETGNIEDFRGVLLRTASSSICVGRYGQTSNTDPFVVGIDEEGNEQWSWTVGHPGGSSRFYGIIPVQSNGGGLAYGSYSIDGVLRGFIMWVAPPTGVSGIVTQLDSEEPLANVRISAVGQERYAVTDASGAYALELAAGTYDVAAYSPCVESDTVFSVVIPDDGQVALDLELGVPQFEHTQSSVNVMAMNHQTASGVYHLTNSGNGAMEYSVAAYCIDPPGNWMTCFPAEGVVLFGETQNIEITVQPDTTDDGAYSFYGELQLQTNTCPVSEHVIPVLVAVLDVDETAAEISDFKLFAPFPNPFNSETRIRFNLPARREVSFELFNLNGRLVQTISGRNYSAGQHALTLNMSQYAAGVYWLRLRTEDYSSTQKIVLLK